jgi:uncharacterized protein YuzE
LLPDGETVHNAFFDRDTTVDLDAEGSVLALTLEHASERTDISQLVLEGIAA